MKFDILLIVCALASGYAAVKLIPSQTELKLLSPEQTNQMGLTILTLTVISVASIIWWLVR